MQQGRCGLSRSLGAGRLGQVWGAGAVLRLEPQQPQEAADRASSHVTLFRLLGRRHRPGRLKQPTLIFHRPGSGSPRPGAGRLGVRWELSSWARAGTFLLGPHLAEGVRELSGVCRAGALIPVLGASSQDLVTF